MILAFYNIITRRGVRSQKLMLKTEITTKDLKMGVFEFYAIVTAYSSNDITMFLVL
jgi:hypothetical protein